MVIEDIRSFSRVFTQRVGVLEEEFLGRRRALGATRVLYEIGPSSVAVSDLRSTLDLDSGYLSRIVGQLRDEGLVALVPDPDDGRRRRIVLSEAGTQEWHEIDRLSNARIQAIVDVLGPARGSELAALLRRAGRLIEASTVTFETTDPDSPAARGALHSYFAELDDRFPGGFDASGALDDDAGLFEFPDGCFVLARHGLDVVGCGAVQSIDRRTGEIKRMWIASGWRGLGLARRLLADLEARSRRIGHHRVKLDTNATLTAAIQMYDSAGYRHTGRYNDNPHAELWFEKDLGGHHT